MIDPNTHARLAEELGRMVVENERLKAELAEAERLAAVRLEHNQEDQRRCAELAIRLDMKTLDMQRIAKERDAAIERRNFSQDWYGQRFQRLRRWIDEEVRPLSDELATRYFSICANGIADPYEPSEWRDTIHGQTIRAEQAERVRDEALAANRRIVASNATLTDTLRAQLAQTKEALADVVAGAPDRNNDDEPVCHNCMSVETARAALASLEAAQPTTRKPLPPKAQAAVDDLLTCDEDALAAAIESLSAEQKEKLRAFIFRARPAKDGA
jgi:hypothetical protein